MSEWRKDPLSDRWVILAQHRATRPYDFEWEVKRRPDASCPFCVGQEHQTPAPVLVLRDPTANDVFPWHVRIVPNRYPAVNDDVTSAGQAGQIRASENHAAGGEGSDPALPSPLRDGCIIGHHDVLIESPDHHASFAGLPQNRLELCFEAVRQRFCDYRREGRFRYGLMFKNVGPLAGASLEHPHSQLMSLTAVPLELARQIDLIQEWDQQTGRCLGCDILTAEQREATRILGGTKHFLAYCPYASRFPYEVRIMHRLHHHSFEDAEPGEIRELSECVQRVLKMLTSVLGSFSYNLILHIAPFDTNTPKHYHWYVEIFPRLTMTAGFEWGSGYFLNTMAPENAAASLRNGQGLEIHESQDFSVWKNW